MCLERIKVNDQSFQSRVARLTVDFMSEREAIKGHLYMPDRKHGQLTPALIIGGPLTTIKEQVVGLYAQKLAAKGYACLTFDPRHFGESEGMPRNYESPERKIRDFRNAITFLTSFSEIDIERVGAVGICASAGYLARVAADDERLRTLALVAPLLHNTKTILKIYGGVAGVLHKVELAQEDKKVFALTGKVRYAQVVSETDISNSLLGRCDYFLDSYRGDIPEWSNQFAVMSWEDWLSFSPFPEANQIKQPVLMIHSEQAVLPDNAKQFFTQLTTTNKVLRWMDATQVDFYDNPKCIDEVVEKVCHFMKARF